jgi:2-keto-4-pentenoate hydratase
MSNSATSTAVREIATALARAEEAGEPIAPLTVTNPELTVADAYAIQELNAAARTGGSYAPKIVGHKIGLTSLPMQQMLGVDEPDYGVLYSDRVHESGAAIETSKLIAPRIEPELAFVLDKDLEGGDVSVDQVLDATSHVVAALEVIDSRIADWKIKLVDTIADNASCGSAILGNEPISISDIDLVKARVELKRDGEVVDSGTGDAVLGHPAEAVAWLANALADFGVVLRKGEVILSGSITAAIPIEPGQEITADFGALGSATAVIK